MLKEYLDKDLYSLIIKNFSFDDINEIRMRVNKNLIVVIKNKKYFLKDEGGNYVVVSKILIDNFVKKACENSVYAYNENIINGYITLPNGVRVGLSGQVVSEDGKVLTIKDFQAVNIRIPHFIKNCSLPVFDLIFEDDFKNTLIISKPGAGKTTFLRDLIYQLGEHNIPLDVLVADERNEICALNHGETIVELSNFCDVYTNCSKNYAFNNGIRSMRPDVIMTDEIDIEKDLSSIENAINSGVSVVATIHAKDLQQLRNKQGFIDILKHKYFSRFVLLTQDEGPGTIAGVFDENLNCIYCK